MPISGTNTFRWMGILFALPVPQFAQGGASIMQHPDPRIRELLDLAEAERFTLALPPALILKMEDAGAIVNLRTGAIVIGGVAVRYAPTEQALERTNRYQVVQTAQGGFVLDTTTGQAYAIVIPTDNGGDPHG